MSLQRLLQPLSRGVLKIQRQYPLQPLLREVSAHTQSYSSFAANLEADHEQDPFGVLGLTVKANKEEIKAAFLALAKEHHPDTNAGCVESEKAFKKIHAAYEVLQDDKARWRLKAAGNISRDTQRTSTRPRGSYDEKAKRAQEHWHDFLENKESFFARYQNAFAVAEEYDNQVKIVCQHDN